MNYKIKFALLFSKLRKPLGGNNTLTIKEMRLEADRAGKLGSFLFNKKISIESVQDLMINKIPIRIYKNSKTENERVIIYYHGGGFALYGLDSHDLVCRRLCAQNNCVVVSVDYRLAPENSFPAAHEDAFEAIVWVKENISKHGGNPNALIVAGDSAGGNLAACMAHRCKRENILLKAQILIYPWIDGRLNNPSIDRNGKGYFLEKDAMFWFQKVYTPKEEDRCVPEISPCFEKYHTELAPAFILTAELDPLLDDGYNYYKQLEAAKTTVRYKEYKELFHGFFNIPLIHKNALEAYNDIYTFLESI